MRFVSLLVLYVPNVFWDVINEHTEAHVFDAVSDTSATADTHECNSTWFTLNAASDDDSGLGSSCNKRRRT